jgi:hypothetical protein
MIKFKYSILRAEKNLFGSYLWIDKQGIWFLYKGDEVGWLYWWKRKDQARKWLSVSFETTFTSLKEMDDLWEAYFNELGKEQK